MTSLTANDRIAILELVTRADVCATHRDVAGYVALFSEDAVMDGDQGTAAGAAAIAQAVRRVWAGEPPGALHLTCNAVVDEPASGPEVSSVLVLLTARDSGTSCRASTAAVRQSVVRTSGGWRIRERSITILPDPDQHEERT